MLQSFWVQNYRSFQNHQEIQVRPLTLLFGRNNSGKGSLVRFLPWLCEPVTGDDALKFDGEVMGKAPWKSISRAAGHVLRFGLTWRLPAEHATAEGTALSASWEVGRRGDGQAVAMTVGNRRIVRPPDRDPGSWVGLTPNGPLEFNDPVRAVRLHLKQLRPDVRWLSTRRERLPYAVAPGLWPNAPLAPNGNNVVSLLVDAHVDFNHKLFASLNLLLEPFGVRLSVEEITRKTMGVFFRPITRPNVKINVASTGSGYASALPVLYALALAQRCDRRILCFEQPDAHLDPYEQDSMAKALIQTANAKTEPRLLVETHSEVMLTRVQLAIAKGEIRNDKVIAYYVERLGDGTSHLIPVTFNRWGQPNSSALTLASHKATLARELYAEQREAGAFGVAAPAPKVVP